VISQRAIPDHVTYCASKGAVNQITRTMAIELGKYGVRTNNVNPTVVLTRMGKIAWSDPVKSTPILNRIPLGRFAGTYPASPGRSRPVLSSVEAFRRCRPRGTVRLNSTWSPNRRETRSTANSIGPPPASTRLTYFLVLLTSDFGRFVYASGRRDVRYRRVEKQKNRFVNHPWTYSGGGQLIIIERET